MRCVDTLGEWFRARSVQRERARDDPACRLVRTHHDPGGGDPAVEELQPGGDGAFREQALARADDEGEDPQAVLVDEAVAQQRLDRVPAAMHLQLWPERGHDPERGEVEEADAGPRVGIAGSSVLPGFAFYGLG